jgi:hypothetical protein
MIWLKLVVKELLVDSISLLSIFLLYYFEILVNLEYLIFLLYLINEDKICNRYMMNKDLVYWLALKPVATRIFFLLTSVLIILLAFASFWIIVGILAVWFQHDLPSLGKLFFVFVSSTMIVIAVGNFISNSKIAFSYVFIGIPVLRLFLFTLAISFSFFINYIIKNSFSISTALLILLASSFGFLISILKQDSFNCKYQFIRLVKRKYEGS